MDTGRLRIEVTSMKNQNDARHLDTMVQQVGGCGGEQAGMGGGGKAACLHVLLFRLLGAGHTASPRLPGARAELCCCPAPGARGR
jgi:hypothetical protein